MALLILLAIPLHFFPVDGYRNHRPPKILAQQIEFHAFDSTSVYRLFLTSTLSGYYYRLRRLAAGAQLAQDFVGTQMRARLKRHIA